VSKGGVAVIEEGLFAGSNFLIGILLARWLEPVDYGAFTAAFSLFLLLGTAFYSSICVQPVLVFAPREDASRFRQYFGCLLWIHAGVASIISIATAAIAAVLWYGDSFVLAKTFLALTLAGPFITLLWLARRAHYALLKPHWPLFAGALYLVLLVLGCYALARTHWLSPQSALIIIGAASLASSIPLIALVGPRRWASGSDLRPSATLMRHWQYGKWSALTSCMRWSTNYGYYLILPLYLGLEASAVLRAHMNLLLPILHANSAVCGILVPQFAKIAAAQRKSELRRFTYAVLALYAVGALTFWGLLLVFAQPIFDFLYGGHYPADIRLLALLGLLPLSGGVAGVLESALFATGRPNLAAMSYAVSALVTLTVGWGLLAMQGVMGAGMGLLAASIATAAAMAWLFLRSTGLKDVATITDTTQGLAVHRNEKTRTGRHTAPVQGKNKKRKG
jgi:O-antigen/teichoic acid export membrane protein